MLLAGSQEELDESREVLVESRERQEALTVLSEETRGVDRDGRYRQLYVTGHKQQKNLCPCGKGKSHCDERKDCKKRLGP